MQSTDAIDVELNAIGIVFIKPFQIHSIQHVSTNAEGYLISIASFIMPNFCSEILQNTGIPQISFLFW